MQACSATRDIGVNWQGPRRKLRHHLTIKLSKQCHALPDIPTFDQQNALLEFEHSDCQLSSTAWRDALFPTMRGIQRACRYPGSKAKASAA